MSRTHLLLACGLVMGAAACVDRPAPVATDDGTPGVTGPVAAPGAASPRTELSLVTVQLLSVQCSVAGALLKRWGRR